MIRKSCVFLLVLVMLQALAAPCYASSSSVISISAGASHCLALTSDGSVLAWGSNDHGQLGDGTTVSTSTPVKVKGLAHVVAIAAGAAHSLALKDDGTVWAWGDNYNGNLGDGTTEDRLTPVQVVGLTNVKAIAAGIMTSFALKDDGTLWAWGVNSRGDLGDGTLEDRLTPVQVKVPAKVVKIGHKGTFAVTDDGDVWAWGNNVIIVFGNNSICGMLGDNYDQVRPTPFRVEQLSNVKEITNGLEHVVFIKDDGTVWTWGLNDKGQLGNNAKIDDKTVTTTPVKALGINNVKDVSAGYYYSLALKNDGSVWKWGEEYYTIPNMPGVYSRLVSAPEQIGGLSGIIAISSGNNFYIALKDDGSVWGWGYNENGQLGSHASFVSAPVKIIDGSSHTSTPTVYATPSAIASANPCAGASANNPITPTGATATYPVSASQNWLDLRIMGLIGLLIIIIGAAYVLFTRK